MQDVTNTNIRLRPACCEMAILYQHVLLSRPTPEQLMVRWGGFMAAFRDRIPLMPPWFADEFTKVLAGAARGPVLDFDLRVRARQFAIEISRAARKVNHELPST